MSLLYRTIQTQVTRTRKERIYKWILFKKLFLLIEQKFNHFPFFNLKFIHINRKFIQQSLFVKRDPLLCLSPRWNKRWTRESFAVHIAHFTLPYRSWRDNYTACIYHFFLNYLHNSFLQRPKESFKQRLTKTMDKIKYSLTFSCFNAIFLDFYFFGYILQAA